MKMRLWLEVAGAGVLVIGALLYGESRRQAGQTQEKDDVARVQGALVMADLKKLRPRVQKTGSTFHKKDSAFRDSPSLDTAFPALDAAVIHIAGQDTVIAKLDTLVASQQVRLSLKTSKPNRVIPYLEGSYEPFTKELVSRFGVRVRFHKNLFIGVAGEVRSGEPVRQYVTLQYTFR